MAIGNEVSRSSHGPVGEFSIVPPWEEDIAPAAENTDKEIWREKADDYYSPSIHVTKDGSIGINVGGVVIVMPVTEWYSLACPRCPECGYTEQDAKIHGDHHLCKGKIPSVKEPLVEYCDHCDGCGWYEGGPTIKTTCKHCNGTGIKAKALDA